MAFRQTHNFDSFPATRYDIEIGYVIVNVTVFVAVGENKIPSISQIQTARGMLIHPSHLSIFFFVGF